MTGDLVQSPATFPHTRAGTNLNGRCFSRLKQKTDEKTMKPLPNRDRTKKHSSCLTNEKTMFSLKKTELKSLKRRKTDVLL